MKVDKLIRQLTELREKHGNITVRVMGYYCGKLTFDKATYVKDKDLNSGKEFISLTTGK